MNHCEADTEFVMFVTLAARAEKIEDRPQCFGVTIIQHPDRKKLNIPGK
jgi:hypothetical protein